MRLGGGEEKVLAFGIEADHPADYPFAFGELFQQLAGGIVEVEMVVSVTLALPDEFLRIAGKEEDRLLRFDVMFVRFGEQVGFLLACQGGVAYQMHFVLFAVQLGDIDALFVGAPGDVCEILLFRGTCFQPDGIACRQVVDTDRYLMALHAGHRVFHRFGLGTAGVDIDDRIVGHHALVHAVERQGGTLRRPEQAFVDAELPLVDGLSAYDTLFCFTCNNSLLIVR